MSTTTSVDCGVRLESGVRCRMYDGVTLVSDHYYPPASGPHLTLLMRQPYGRDIASTVAYAYRSWFARHGCNVVIQVVRGRGESDGEVYPFRHEARDGAETIDWLRSRCDSNGPIGTYGFSCQGLTQLWPPQAYRRDRNSSPLVLRIAPKVPANSRGSGAFATSCRGKALPRGSWLARGSESSQHAWPRTFFSGGDSRMALPASLARICAHSGNRVIR
ncbi:MAG TPA: CocE/NonD family hydrolase [Candidatus Aquilonibacter sp.]|nr:CocE/NonD family hydrolase [Candidatus Aquilonibacter sp.]